MHQTKIGEQKQSPTLSQIAPKPSAGAPPTRTEQETATQNAVIRVLLVDDHTLMREGLRQLLSLEEDIDIVGEASDGFEAMQKIRQIQPQVILLDINLPVVDGITLTRQITQEYPDISVIILTMYRQNQYMLQALKNGAKGYLPKSASAAEVAETIRKVHAEGLAIEPEMTRAIVNEYRRLAEASSEGQSTELLTEKELEIVRYVAAGLSNKEIAEKLSYSEKTVKNYLSIIFQKLHLRDRTQVAIFALRHGLLTDEEVQGSYNQP
ncbi:LuxR family two component transcriptional regulator [Thermosporothrix hazakensis]|uniref:LuxR family two component transcriptional regulator n=2 Tax=Thermosporothrix TaxID=768650 RepID=A0A326U145_THEHA|nr:response regulator transcription factor [Thermosporothrix hazakensis]PZW23333.1 LuxR family two component transcriptional regulator [Thermosporothrix hazakensis]BBH89554.1 DNA-binding response regulator [Thermosporothrix sp. COM3]GCE47740.1 DNA-binding response regulator [Thermosporothrix hazakensis]